MAIRCLIVDDNALFGEAARTMLERKGITVVGVAHSSEEGLRQVRELRPDVALVDIDLGAESGFDLAERLESSSTRVILISTHDECEFVELIRQSPAVAFVAKAHLSADAIYRLLNRAPVVPSPRPGT